MSKESQALFEACKAARRSRGMTQSELARRVRATQSAISMFEGGRFDALAEDKVQALAKVLELDISGYSKAPTADVLKFCPSPRCPGNIPYVVDGALLFHPALTRAPSAKATYCRDCGEVLEGACPVEGCSAPVRDGAICETCGKPFITANLQPGTDPETWAARRRAEIRELWALAQARAKLATHPAGGASVGLRPEGGEYDDTADKRP